MTDRERVMTEKPHPQRVYCVTEGVTVEAPEDWRRGQECPVCGEDDAVAV